MVDPDNALATAEEEAHGDLASLADLDDTQLNYLANLDQVEDPLSDGVECDTGEREETSAEEADFREWQRELDAGDETQLRSALAPVRDPYSLWRPFGGKSTTALTHDIICVHTMVGTLAGSWAWASQAGNPYWHYGVNGQGVVWQCQDLRYRSAANLNGNWHVIPIETSDIKEGVFPATWQDPLWTNAQVDTLVKLIAWLCKRFNIPPVLIPDTRPGRRGLAYHRQGIPPHLVSGGEKWSNAFGKACPANRIHQFINVVIPRVQRLVAGGGVDDSMSAADVAALKKYMDQQLKDLRSGIKTDAEAIAEAHDDPGFFRVVDEGWVSGWPVYHTNFLNTLNKVENRDPLDQFVVDTKRLAREGVNALRVAPEILDQLWQLAHGGEARDRSHLEVK